MNKLYHDFPLENVFEFKAIKQAKSQKDIPTDDNGVPYVVQSTVNNMVARFVNKQYLIDNDEAPVDGNAIVLGVTLPAVSYQKNEFGASQVITARSEHLDEKTGIYLVSVLSKYMEQFSYQRKPGMAIYKAMEVSFPVIESSDVDHEYTVDDIDWQYMRDRITELERDRITELDAYLQATGLNDYELTEDDKKVLSQKVEYDSFQINDVFEPLKVGFVGKGQKIGSATKEPDDVHCVPLTCAKIGDNGIMYWGKKGDFITYKNTLAVIADGAVSAGLVYAQPEEAGAYSHSYFIDTKEKDVSKYAKQYLSSVLTKVIYPKYSREDAPRWNRIETEMIYLPIKSDGTPDFDYMEKYIRAMEKVVIADVVKYKDKVIETTKKVVGA